MLLLRRVVSLLRGETGGGISGLEEELVTNLLADEKDDLMWSGWGE
jgi:hypothetical protein